MANDNMLTGPKMQVPRHSYIHERYGLEIACRGRISSMCLRNYAIILLAAL